MALFAKKKRSKLSLFVEKRITMILATASSLILAVGIVFGFLHPVTYAVVGDPPFAGRTEIAAAFDDVRKGLAAVSRSTELASAKAQQALDTSNENRLRRLMDDRVELQAKARMAPRDMITQSALAQKEIDIQKLLAEMKLSQSNK